MPSTVNPKRVPRDLDTQPCPFCAEIPGFKNFVRHVSRHCEEVALSSLSQGTEEDSEDGENSRRCSLVLALAPPTSPYDDLRRQGLTPRTKDPYEMQDDRTESPNVGPLPNDWHKSDAGLSMQDLHELEGNTFEYIAATASTQQPVRPGDSKSDRKRYIWYCCNCGDGPHGTGNIPGCWCHHIQCNTREVVVLDSSKTKASSRGKAAERSVSPQQQKSSKTP
jgi:hypothetical protein